MFLASLIDRALDGRTAIAPRRASRYETDLGLADPAWSETEAAAAAPPQTARPLAATGDSPLPTSIHAAPTEQAPQLPAPVAPDSAPMAPAPRAIPSAAPASMLTSIVERLEHLPPPAPAAPSSQAAPLEATRAAEPGLREIHTHERVEVREPGRTIEQRLEVLTREHVIERIAREVVAPAASDPPSAAPPTSAAPTVEPLRPRPAPTVPAAAPRASRRDATPPALAAASPPPAATIVQVTIGRVEVRGAPAPASRSVSRPREPRVGLDDYLRRREQG